MYELSGYRLQQTGSCSYKRVTVNLGNGTYDSVDDIIKALNRSGYDKVSQYNNGINTENLFFDCFSNSKYPLGHKFHEISVTAKPRRN